MDIVKKYLGTGIKRFDRGEYFKGLFVQFFLIALSYFAFQQLLIKFSVLESELVSNISNIKFLKQFINNGWESDLLVVSLLTFVLYTTYLVIIHFCNRLDDVIPGKNKTIIFVIGLVLICIPIFNLLILVFPSDLFKSKKKKISTAEKLQQSRNKNQKLVDRMVETARAQREKIDS